MEVLGLLAIVVGMVLVLISPSFALGWVLHRGLTKWIGKPRTTETVFIAYGTSFTIWWTGLVSLFWALR